MLKLSEPGIYGILKNSRKLNEVWLNFLKVNYDVFLLLYLRAFMSSKVKEEVAPLQL